MATSMHDETTIDYSIVIPVYYNEGSLRTTVKSIRTDVIARNADRTYEIIFVDDGSGDGSLEELLELRKEDPQAIKIIKLTRNFGQPNARLAGLIHARGRCVITMSADNQDPAALIHEMLAAHFEEGYQVVAAARSGRDESWYRVVTSRVFYWLMKSLSFPNMPAGGFDFVLLGREVTDVVLRNQEANPFFQGQLLWTGYRTKFIEYQRLQRKQGRSRWTLGMKIKLLLDGIMNYSFLPIRFISVAGIFLGLLGFLFAAFILVRRLFWGTEVPGWAALMMVFLVTNGLQTLMLGIVGEYLWRVLAEVRKRDPYVIEHVYEDTELPAAGLQ